MERRAHQSILVSLTLVAGALLVFPTGSSAAQAPSSPPAQPDIHEHVAVSAVTLTPTRETSGTAWVPRETPMFGVHRPWKGWDLRLDGTLFVQAIVESRDRHRTGGFDTRDVDSRNWGMFSARRSVGEGRLGIRTMLSAEAWTVRRCGSLSFLATGEVCDGDNIHDWQEPHDLLMELAFEYEEPMQGDWRWQLYGALAGEPALGPPGYAHRASATMNPTGPITHHWLDSTHVSFGVLTVGVNNRRWKVEASMFNGRAPDESRADLDFGFPDSVSGRVSFLPTDRLALQMSVARMYDAASDFIAGSPAPVARLTASAVYHRLMGEGSYWATTAALGANRALELTARNGVDPNPCGTVHHLASCDSSARQKVLVGALLESTLTLSERHSIFVRGEIERIPAHHLHAFEYATSVFTVGKVQAGYVRLFGSSRGLVPGVGASAGVSLLPPELTPHYGGQSAPSFNVFFTLRAGRHEM